MNTIEYNSKRQLLIDGFKKQLQDTVDSDEALSVDGQIGRSWGQIKLGNYVLVYTDFPQTNSLDIQVGEFGKVKGTQPQAVFNADLVNNRWVNRLEQRQYLDNQELVEHCVGKLRQLAKESNRGEPQIGFRSHAKL
jgi:hypothetical protein